MPNRLTQAAALLLCALLPAVAMARGPSMFHEVRDLVHQRHLLHVARRSVRAAPSDGARAARVTMLAGQYRRSKQHLVTRIKRSPVGQLAHGVLVDGPKEFAHGIKQHPVKTGLVLVGTAGAATLLGLAGLPIDTVALCASGGLTAKTIIGKLPEVRARFRRRAPDRWRAAGEHLVFPAAAFAAGVGAGALAEEGTALLTRSAGVHSPALGLGLKSTAQTVDDLVPVAGVMGHRPHGAGHVRWWHRKWRHPSHRTGQQHWLQHHSKRPVHSRM